MSRSCRLITLLIVAVLGFQAAAMAAHTHFLPAAANGQPTHHMLAADAADHGTHHGGEPADHHSASCVVAQSCFPVAHVVAPLATAATLKPVTPRPAPRAALASTDPDPLLRPPRAFA